MNILFLGYWGANEGLSQSTINPHLEILAHFEQVTKIIYVSMERNPSSEYLVPNHQKIQHIPYKSIHKALDFLALPFKLAHYFKKYQIDLLMCRSSLSGSIGHIATRLVNIPYTVESFEPHADYMLELGIWEETGMMYRVQHHLEQKQKVAANHLMPVSYNYKKRLIDENVPESNLSVIPCAVDHVKFGFSEEARKSVRKKLGIQNGTVVGVYVGKFGDIYWDEEAFEVFKSAFSHFRDFFLVILTPHDADFIQERLDKVGIDTSAVFSGLVSHDQVSDHLSAADFAFSTIKPTPFRRYCSPIKNGEYWANGLPILSPKNIGDDSDIIVEEGGGLIIDDHLKVNWHQIELSDTTTRHQNRIRELAIKHRSLNCVKEVYERLIVDRD